LNPLFRVETIKWLFEDPDNALLVVREKIRTRLIQTLYPDTPTEADEWVISGTEEWNHLENYSFLEEGIEFNFSSYQVAPFAAGLPTAILPYDEIKDLLKETSKQLLSVY